MIRLPNFIVLAYLEVPKVAKPGPTELAIAICHLVNTKCHKNVEILINNTDTNKSPRKNNLETYHYNFVKMMDLDIFFALYQCLLRSRMYRRMVDI